MVNCLSIFAVISIIKFKLISLFVVRNLTVSLRGPVLTLRRGRQPELSTILRQEKDFLEMLELLSFKKIKVFGSKLSATA